MSVFAEVFQQLSENNFETSSRNCYVNCPYFHLSIINCCLQWTFLLDLRVGDPFHVLWLSYCFHIVSHCFNNGWKNIFPSFIKFWPWWVGYLSGISFLMQKLFRAVLENVVTQLIFIDITMTSVCGKRLDILFAVQLVAKCWNLSNLVIEELADNF